MEENFPQLPRPTSSLAPRKSRKHRRSWLHPNPNFRKAIKPLARSKKNPSGTELAIGTKSKKIGQSTKLMNNFFKPTVAISDSELFTDICEKEKQSRNEARGKYLKRHAPPAKISLAQPRTIKQINSYYEIGHTLNVSKPSIDIGRPSTPQVNPVIREKKERRNLYEPKQVRSRPKPPIPKTTSRLHIPQIFPTKPQPSILGDPEPACEMLEALTIRPDPLDDDDYSCRPTGEITGWGDEDNELSTGWGNDDDDPRTGWIDLM